MKGFIITLDAILALTLVLIIATAFSFSAFTGQEDFLILSAISKSANDMLIVLDKSGVLETLDENAIKQEIEKIIPPNYCAELSVISYECKTQACTEFEVIDQFGINICRKPVDVMLVFDRSGSMDDDGIDPGPGPCQNQPQPICDAKQAAKSFLDNFNPDIDKAGLVSFSTTATLDEGLTSNINQVKNEIDSLTAGGRTAIGDGIQTANNELINNGRSDVPWTQVLLTDGKNNEGIDPLTAASNAAANNIVIYTIGLGSNIDSDILQQIANMTGGKNYTAPTSDDLFQIYNEISAEIFGERTDIIGARRSFLTFQGKEVDTYNIATLRLWLK